MVNGTGALLSALPVSTNTIWLSLSPFFPLPVCLPSLTLSAFPSVSFSPRFSLSFEWVSSCFLQDSYASAVLFSEITSLLQSAPFASAVDRILLSFAYNTLPGCLVNLTHTFLHHSNSSVLAKLPRYVQESILGCCIFDDQSVPLVEWILWLVECAQILGLIHHSIEVTCLKKLVVLCYRKRDSILKIICTAHMLKTVLLVTGMITLVKHCSALYF